MAPGSEVPCSERWRPHVSQRLESGPLGFLGTNAHEVEASRAPRVDPVAVKAAAAAAALAEEKAFLKNYTVPFVQLEPKKTILVFSHIQNTFDKKRLLENGENKFQKKSDKLVDDFVKQEDIKTFYMEKIDELLQNYTPGDPSNKPDVLKQMKEIEERRDKMIKDMQEKQKNGPIMMNEPGKPPRQLNNQEVVQLIQSQQQQLKAMNEEKIQLNNTLMAIQSQLIQASMKADSLEKEKNELLKKYNELKPNTEPNITISKTTPTVSVDVNAI